MARKPHPWFREDRNVWSCVGGGRRPCLGEHPPGAPKPEKSRKPGRWNSPPEIDEAFGWLLSGDLPQAPAGGDTVVAVLDAFVSWAKENRAGITAGRYEEFIQDFVKARPEEGGLQFGALPGTRLTGKHVTAWLNQRPGWGPTTKGNAITAPQRGCNWACRNHGPARNPIAGMGEAGGAEPHRPGHARGARAAAGGRP